MIWQQVDASASALLSKHAADKHLRTQSKFFTYLINSMKTGSRSVGLKVSMSEIWAGLGSGRRVEAPG